MGGVLAVGREGRWKVTILEEEEGFSIQLDSPGASLQCNLPDIGPLRSLRQFLGSDGHNDRWFELPSSVGVTVMFAVRNSRLWIRLIAPGAQLLEVPFELEEAETLGLAIDNAFADLEGGDQA